MWICANDGFVSIVDKAKNRTRDLHVRARMRGHLLALFPKAKVAETPGGDYRFRADIPRAEIGAVIAARIAGIGYDNFKDSVPDKALHDAYSRVWSVMGDLQPGGPYGMRGRRGRGRGAGIVDLFDPASEAEQEAPAETGLTQDHGLAGPCESCCDEPATWRLFGQRLCDSCVLDAYGNHGRAAASL